MEGGQGKFLLVNKTTHVDIWVPAIPSTFAKTVLWESVTAEEAKSQYWYAAVPHFVVVDNDRVFLQVLFRVSMFPF